MNKKNPKLEQRTIPAKSISITAKNLINKFNNAQFDYDEEDFFIEIYNAS